MEDLCMVLDLSVYLEDPEDLMTLGSSSHLVTKDWQKVAAALPGAVALRPLSVRLTQFPSLPGLRGHLGSEPGDCELFLPLKLHLVLMYVVLYI